VKPKECEITGTKDLRLEEKKFYKLLNPCFKVPDNDNSQEYLYYERPGSPIYHIYLYSSSKKSPINSTDGFLFNGA